MFYEQGTYYAYERLREVRGRMPRSGQKNTERVDKLLFRITNCVHPVTIWLCGTDTDLTAEYLQAGSSKAQILRLAGAADCRKAADSGTLPDLLCLTGDGVGEELVALMEGHAAAGSATVWCGIHDSAQRKRAWKQTIGCRRAGVSFDLYDVGLLFYDCKRPKQHYIVNF